MDDAHAEVPLETLAAVTAALDDGTPIDEACATHAVATARYVAAKERLLAELAAAEERGDHRRSRAWARAVEAARRAARARARRARRLGSTSGVRAAPAAARVAGPSPAAAPPPPAASSPGVSPPPHAGPPPTAAPAPTFAPPAPSPPPHAGPPPRAWPPPRLAPPAPAPPLTAEVVVPPPRVAAPPAAPPPLVAAAPPPSAPAHAPPAPAPGPAAGAAALRGTMMHDGPLLAGPALPFERSAPAQRPAEPPAPPRAERARAGHTMVTEVSQVLAAIGAPLPFAAASGAAPGTPSTPSPEPPALEAAARPAPALDPAARQRAESFTLAQYARLCAELRADPESAPRVRAGYGVDGAAWTHMHTIWQARFRDDPTLKFRWEKQVEQILAKLRGA
jgi:hypothetical protein